MVIRFLILSICCILLIHCSPSDIPLPVQEEPLPTDIYFPPLQSQQWETLSPQSLGWCDTNLADLQAFLQQANTKAFIILKNGRIVTEWYFDGHTRERTHVWNSAGKTITSFLIGKAQENQRLSISEPSSTYLGSGWSSLSREQEDAITIRHHLTMSTGLDFQVSNVHCTLPSCLDYLHPPGSYWYYHNAPYTLLTSMIEAATGMHVNQYADQELLSKIGMDGGFQSLGFVRIFQSTARSMARFGLLIQENGAWEGLPIMQDQDYFREMINPSQEMNPSYGYLWWLNGKEKVQLPGMTQVLSGPMMPDAPDDVIAALGANDQTLFVWPSEKIVVVRMGDNAGYPRLGGGFENELWKKIAKLNCE